MPRHEITRRHALQSAAAGAACGVLGLGRRTVLAADTAAPPSSVKILEPFHGAVLNHRHGKQMADSLTIRVTGEANLADKVTVNGVVCRRAGKRFETEVPLRAHENELLAVAEGMRGRQESRVRVVWDRYSKPRYRFAIDDASYFLRDIAHKEYASLFDCPFLKGLRDLNKRYGAKFCVNVYYVACDDSKYPTDGDFRLPQFPDRYKSEWRGNAH